MPNPLRESILGLEDLKRQAVEVPEWNCTVYLREMTSAERDRFEGEVAEATKGGKRLDNIRARVVVLVAVDDQGRRIFNDDDAAALGAKSAKALDRLFEIAVKLAGITDESVKAAGKA